MDASFGGSFDTVTLAHRCRRGASTPSPIADPEIHKSRIAANADSRESLLKTVVFEKDQ
jgi:hypothetical protein